MTSFKKAFNHAMKYEVGGFWNESYLDDPEVQQGLISTAAQKKKVGFVNLAADRGGVTKFGIAQNSNPHINVKTLTLKEAEEVYLKKYWEAAGCHLLSDVLAVLHFDGAINHGVGRASKFLQEVLGFTVLDGIVGPKTAAFAKNRNELELCNALCNRRQKFYDKIVQNDPSQQQFYNGWMRRINEMRTFCEQELKE